MNYQKVYMNQIHSSSLLCQLAQMWRSQLVCDAYIRTGTITTKAHRVVLLAACPMLQSMEKASTGSHLEVRLTADIKQEAVNMFLQYLYEGFMLLTEDNVKDVEKVARLLQVDSVIKCCADFYKCLETKTGNNVYSSSKYKYTSYDMLEFRHVRATDLQKTVQDRLMKRASEMARPTSPTSKKQRLYRSSPPPGDQSQSSGFSHRADDTFSMSHSYGSSQQEPWDRVPRPGTNASSGFRGQRNQQPSVIDIVEDSIELVHVDSGEGGQPPSQKGVSVSVASQLDNGPPNISIVSVSGNTGPPHGPQPGQGQQRPHGAPPFHPSQNMTSTPHSSRQPTSSSSPSAHQRPSDRSVISLSEPQISQITREISHQLQQQEQQSHSASSVRPPQLQLAPGLTSPHENVMMGTQQRPPQFSFTERLPQSVGKPFAAGSVRQASSLQSASSSAGSPSTRPDRSPSLSGKSDSMDRPPSVEASKDSSKQKGEDSSTASSADLMADITIIKVESGDEGGQTKELKDSGQTGQMLDSGGSAPGDTTGGLDMHVDAPDDGETSGMQIRRVGDDGMPQEGDSDIEELEATGDWGHDDNDETSMSSDPNNPLGGFRDKHATDVSEQELKSSIDTDHSHGDVGSGRIEEYDMYGESILPPPKFLRKYAGKRITQSAHIAQSEGGQYGNGQYGQMIKSRELSFDIGDRKPYNPPEYDVSKFEKPVIKPVSYSDTSTKTHYEDDFGAKTGSKAVILTGKDDLPGHKAIPNNIKNGKRCVYCQVHRIKTASGWRVKTNYKCETCDVALCVSEICERNCFVLHHKEMFGDELVAGKI